MGKCVNHPDRETNYLCMKHNVYMCEECIKCRDPEIYCKYRSSCPINFISKKGVAGWIGEEKKVTEEIETATVLFEPDKKEITVPKGYTH